MTTPYEKSVLHSLCLVEQEGILEDGSTVFLYDGLQNACIIGDLALILTIH